MKILVTGSSGHLGEALIRILRHGPHDPAGLDLRASPFTRHVGSITDRGFVREAIDGIGAVVHTATLHKPHVATHTRQAFIDTNISGTLILLEEAVAAGVGAFVFTSTTSTFGSALRPGRHEPAVWVTEDLRAVPRNIYGVTKLAAEDLCELFHRRQGLACLILRTSRFFPEEDDHRATREAYEDANIKVNEYLFRRADIEDVADAHLRALERVGELGFGRYIISATTPFSPEDLSELAADAPAVVRRRVPEYEPIYARLGWRMFPRIERVYDNERARRDLGWRPRHDFSTLLKRLEAGEAPGSRLTREVGAKGYHDRKFSDGPYPVE